MDDQTSKGDDDMDHNIKLDPAMDQALTDLRERWIRARALDAAVGFHGYAGNLTPFTKVVIRTAKQFEVYIRDGE